MSGISHSVQKRKSFRLSNLTLDIIDFTGAKFLINKRVWLKICLLEFIIHHLVTVLCMDPFVVICTRLCVIVVCQFISSSNAHQPKYCAQWAFHGFHTAL